ncbi:MAG: aminomethyl-transferring glycine dehydrogenase subunit GcvPA [Rhodospirillaceae bacterium]|jgi:glycine dehydrogenase subunit 1|nr:aminomethyl-transferring glycine dehydrogenase subunit GcvPA [Rhodospirillaceae bacterium]MBT5565136.1 aminomethyl-transferring glycine dehydrogenase subunit GcvPA [Rhodospirillaceae bacterium]MBT6088158.1 aminomethyl-transferring glycine dehydrogenase subunit GcvPA [Rhodospirillaceae bacterium]MBT6962241.1 aminomethyl-transferring glycine dehydrogenase subunit GcvPA [Rhodospirillaceae bacterium]MBT7450216.1 aminomethyl-transferring glycine dehydrogenase subunit GcvPA [Rhodospirillaceae bact
MRYLPLTDSDRGTMLSTIGVGSIDELFAELPSGEPTFDLPDCQSEISVERTMNAFARENLSCSDVPSFLGAGNYRHHTPASLDHLIQRGEFLTAYTPYQPEISQGTLQTIFEFQSQVAMMMDMEVANASMYDGATACAEAAAMACRVTKRSRVLMSGAVHPHYRDVTQTQLQHLGLEIECLAPDPIGIEDLIGRVDGGLACVVVQNPGFFGHLTDLTPLAEACHAAGVLLVACVTEPVSLGLVTPPGAMGADIVVGEGQSIAGPASFGGPGVGLFATQEKFLRQMPGRLCGETVDADGRRGFVLTLSTREQHIRREKATSNICTNSGLIALAFTIHMTLLGEAGFARLAEVNHANAVTLANKLGAIKGVKVVPQTFFNEFAITLSRPAAAVAENLAAKSILGGVPVSRFYPSYEELNNVLLVTATEMTTESDMDALVSGLGEALS